MAVVFVTSLFLLKFRVIEVPCVVLKSRKGSMTLLKSLILQIRGSLS